jgi:RNA polymerase sigma factor (sigma-70 family)
MSTVIEDVVTEDFRCPTAPEAKVDSSLRERAGKLLKTEVRFVYVEEFEGLDDDDLPLVALEELLETLRQTGAEQASSVSSDAVQQADREWQADDPLLTFEQEQFLFRSMNLLRYRANCIRSRLSEERPSAAKVRLAEKLLELSEAVRGQLVRSNLRLVGAIARKFSAGFAEVDDCSSDGCMILLGAIDRFDYSRGYRFSTYATHSIQRYFFRAWKVRARRREKIPCTSAEVLPEVAEMDNEAPICPDPHHAVDTLLSRAPEVLDERELWIVKSRFGLGPSDAGARTLREIAADLGVSKERVRQLQLKAMEKLKTLLDPTEFNLDGVAA